MKSKRAFASVLALGTAFLMTGCLSWRTVVTKNEASGTPETATKAKYAIKNITFDNGVWAGGRAERDSYEVFGTYEVIDRIMQYRPGVFEDRGIPVTVNVRNWRRAQSGDWTWFFPFACTGTIVPAFLKEVNEAEIEVTVDGARKQSFQCHGVCHWMLSCLSPLGLCGYGEPPNPKVVFWGKGRGEVTNEPIREALADGIANALLKLEAEAN